MQCLLRSAISTVVLHLQSERSIVIVILRAANFDANFSLCIPPCEGKVCCSFSPSEFISNQVLPVASSLNRVLIHQNQGHSGPGIGHVMAAAVPPRRLNVNVGVLGHVDSGKTSLGERLPNLCLLSTIMALIGSSCTRYILTDPSLAMRDHGAWRMHTTQRPSCVRRWHCPSHAVAALSTRLSTAALDKNPQSKERGITLDLGFSSFSVRFHSALAFCIQSGLVLGEFYLAPPLLHLTGMHTQPAAQCADACASASSSSQSLLTLRIAALPCRGRSEGFNPLPVRNPEFTQAPMPAHLANQPF